MGLSVHWAANSSSWRARGLLLPSLAVDDGMTYLAGGHVEGAQLLFELVGVVDHCG